ncbi:hypothetical protein C8J57DRAFT_1490001 [Mycena rebaudengoi]|nr:hypothetical protein C8J57DRAFT_1490001 [Mycena rebaudengoi]
MKGKECQIQEETIPDFEKLAVSQHWFMGEKRFYVPRSDKFDWSVEEQLQKDEQWQGITRKNWVTLTQHLVTKILWANATLPLVASGIEFATYTNITNGTTRFPAYARKEVILSAGSLRTPGVLQLSGIGDAALLCPLNITTLIDLKTVGNNLQEQSMGREPGGPPAALEYILRLQADLIIKHKVGIHEDPVPIMEYFYVSLIQGCRKYVAVAALQSGNRPYRLERPFQHPKVHVNYFNVSYDMDVQIAGLKLMWKILKPSDLSTGELKEFILLQILELSRTQLAMIRRELGGVVDAYLKVYDTPNVRVVYTSNIPLPLSAYPSASIYGVAEKQQI